MQPNILSAWKFGSSAKHAASTQCIGKRNNLAHIICFAMYGGTRMKVFKFFRNVSREMAKVSWPKGRELFSYTITVIATVLFFAVFFGVIDFGISGLLNTFFE